MVRKATVRKPKAKKTSTAPRRGSNAARLVEEKHIGKETANFEGMSGKKFDNAVKETLRHYGYFYDTKEGIKWAYEWVKKNYTKSNYANFREADTWRTPMTVCSLCKMMLNGAEFDENRMKWIKSKIDETIEYGKQKTKEKKSVEKTGPTRRSPAEIVKERTSDFIAEVEEAVDNMDTEFSAYEELQKTNAPYNTGKAVVDYYTPLLEELTELTARKPKKPSVDYLQLVEGYSHLTKKKQKELLALVKSIVTESEKYMASKKAVRKTRAKKPVSTAQIVSKVKYLSESKEYQVTSVSPDNILGAKEVWLFNVKYRTLTKLNSSATTGLSVKGTTITNFDEDKCEKKKLRKPEEFLGQVAKTTKAKMNREFKNLRTKASSGNGRMNADTIILKVFK